MYRGGARVCGENEFSFPTDVFENSYTYRVRKVFTSCWQYLPVVRGKVQPDTRIIVMLAPRHPPRVSGNVLVTKLRYGQFSRSSVVVRYNILSQHSFEITLPKRSSNSPQRSVRFNSLADYFTLFAVYVYISFGLQTTRMFAPPKCSPSPTPSGRDAGAFVIERPSTEAYTTRWPVEWYAWILIFYLIFFKNFENCFDCRARGHRFYHRKHSSQHYTPPLMFNYDDVIFIMPIFCFVRPADRQRVE